MTFGLEKRREYEIFFRGFFWFEELGGANGGKSDFFVIEDKGISIYSAIMHHSPIKESWSTK